MTPSIIDLRTFATKRLNELPPHSRLRPGYIDMLKHMTAEELIFDALEKELCAAMERDPAFAAHLGLAV